MPLACQLCGRGGISLVPSVGFGLNILTLHLPTQALTLHCQTLPWPGALGKTGAWL